MRRCLFPVLLVLVVLIALELVGAVVLRAYPSIEKTRAGLIGDVDFSDALNTASQAYLLYIPTPNYVRDGIAQHNAQGYRGVAVPLARSKDSLRILFMGGLQHTVKRSMTLMTAIQPSLVSCWPQMCVSRSGKLKSSMRVCDGVLRQKFLTIICSSFGITVQMSWC